MLAENHIVFNVDHIHDVVSVVLPEVLKNFQFHAGLIIIFLLVFDYFDSDFFLCLVVDDLECCSKGALTKKLHDLIPVTNMISSDDFVVALVIVKAMIMIELLFLFIFTIGLAIFSFFGVTVFGVDYLT
jgi:hypothetical protein